MKYLQNLARLALWLAVLCLLLHDFARAQKPPRKHPQGMDLSDNARAVISIYEDSYGSDTLKSIYLAEHPFVEQVTFVDDRSKVIIYINRDSLSGFADFLGSVSLTAKINNRAIEVSPYSEVGKESKPIGVKGVNSSRDFASSLSSFITETNRFNHATFCEFLNRYNEINDRRTIDSKIASLQTRHDLFKQLREGLRALMITTSEGIKQANTIDPAIKIDTAVSSTQLMQIVSAQVMALEIEAKKYQADEISNSMITSILKVKTHLKLIKGYIDYFSKTDGETRRAYSKSIDKDPIFVQHISATFDSAINNFNAVIQRVQKVQAKTAQPTNAELRSMQMRSAVEDIGYVTLQLKNLRDFVMLPQLKIIEKQQDSAKIAQARLLFNARNSIKKSGLFITFDLQLSQASNDCSGATNQLDLEFLMSHPPIRAAYNEFLARTASRYIFAKLEPAVIDLRKEDAKEGDILRIYVARYGSEPNEEDLYNSRQNRSDSLRKKEVLIAAYDIKELGFRMKIADSFLLINRLHVDKDDSDVSPSKYKGAPGVSLMWAYGSDNGKRKFLKWWEPSFGINVSYIDFSESRDVEIGVAGVLGLFRNKIFVVAGKNLNVDKDSSYIGLGFSFTNLAGKFVDADKK
ncbi:hypothetical protein [Chryseolinea lacunae]|uniref:Uncharacterized protein n=1 Tax=Chryseolinea lacunae TaxID=2801331 RepID=A0ABS1KPK2_9BACT|nr:hypothetical protein [Chryseolinea lacunae]MBL0741360.1 hypothetical protein [Chryseolinea lacunae]